MSSDTSLPSGAEAVTWNLADLYAAADDPAIERDLDLSDAEADRLAETYRGRIAGLSAAEMAEMLAAYEMLRERAEKVGNYASLVWAADTTPAAHGALLQRATERGSRLSQKLVFFDLELAATSDEVARAWLADPILAKYHHWLELIRRYHPHLLTEPEEKILAEKSIIGRSAWSRFFNEVHEAARYDFDGVQLTRDQILSKLYRADREERQRAAAVVTAGLKEMQRTTTFIFNNILADKASDDRLRHYPTWITQRNMGNEVDDRTVDALVAAVTARYDIVARYYRLKRRLLGLDELFDYDRYAPLPAADRRYSWAEARQIVLNAYGRFSPRMAELAGLFFDKSWIDAAVRPGKLGGAFSAATTPSVHPYILMNYEARPRDVMTLAHELGHGIHQKLAGGQGLLQADTPLTTAETASVFGEMLVFQDLLSRESDPQVRLAMLTSKLEDSFATCFRQISMNRFEHAIHTGRREEGELPIERFSELWLATQRAMFTDSVTLTDDYGLWWSYVTHFIGTPGYVYAYAFGELLVLALYARYQHDGAGFADAYVEMLSAGGSHWPHEIVKPLGVDLTDPGFWSNGLQILADMVTEAERLAA
ncbi:MAG: M3 family oligoendopeptidase [Chloroflexi bacterium]|nr:M3 family oligoendopeptidase [Chloroflexota bacterium]